MQLWKTVSSLILLSIIVPLAHGQVQLTVEGDASIMGQLNIHASDDTTSLYIGKKVGSAPARSFHTLVGVSAGMNMAGSSGNSFLGYETGANSFGGSNSFFGFQAGKNNDGASNTIYGYRSGENNEGSLNAFLALNRAKTTLANTMHFLELKQDGPIPQGRKILSLVTMPAAEMKPDPSIPLLVHMLVKKIETTMSTGP